ncbi:pyrroloquinoline quinone-dependent dehydrogenase [Pelagibacterium halotolerans]|uniref:Pyrrolo-quinoline quinone n=1 Tax=Pelagibacterium halotolerans (strain DSM 22347 / JCM 15775 / CGMCC 1.7692 / B2) TaxID=1082931 RepID=G4R5Z1_PELHB|nr:PQQ-binding-like beta-propeller repeat protein [Pelagibacterium halotolerans]AEQ51106.1 pyrrolo-quinoline quinone [Pelagibacterium halotolerans B2]QJR19014.1 PQQ-binding-like beta-propeller repeat protein [Pelagibacterium halotolerans]
MMGTRKLLGFLAIAASSASLLSMQTAMAQDNPIDSLTPVTDEMLADPPDGDWLMWRRTYDGWGYSPLDEINKDNVGDLQLAWAWGMSPGGRSQETPLVHDGILYLQNSSHLIQALDGATGDLIWEYEYELPDDVNPSGERSKAIYDDKLIIATRDAHLIALDAKTGQLIWDKQVANYEHGFAFSSGPIVANGVVVQGMTSCSNAQPGGCFFTGHDVDTGEELWRVHTIARGDTPEGNSWNGLPLESRHGASAWITGSYDPEQNLIFAGVGQPYPWNVEIAGLTPPSSDPNVTNEALYTNSTLAIDVTTGELEWYHQYLETDSLDLDYAYERILVDLPFNGEMRQQVVTTGKIGIIESLDRTTGEWLWAQETAPQNVVLSIDPDTGEKEINPEVIPVIGETTFNCPADPGAKAWQATAYSPRTETLYLPTVEFCSNTTVNPLDPGEIYTGGGLQTFARVPHPDGDGNIGQVRAINLTDQSEVWQYRQYAPITSSTLPTAGGVVFVGSLDRKFMALDDETGEVLWESGPLSNSLESFPISYEAGGKQYVAVVANWASGLGRLASLTPDIRLPADNPATLYVFALPD